LPSRPILGSLARCCFPFMISISLFNPRALPSAPAQLFQTQVELFSPSLLGRPIPCSASLSLRCLSTHPLVLVTHTCNSSYSGDRDRRISVQGQPREIVQETYLENTQHKKGAGGVAQVVEHLPCKCEALSLNCSTTKERKTSRLSLQGT
jgi:hypothetical protein